MAAVAELGSFDAFAFMELSWRIEPEGCRRATWIHIRPRRSFAILGWLLILLAAFVIAAILFRGPHTAKAIGVAGVLAALLAYLAAYFFLLLPMHVTKLYRQHNLLQEDYTADVEDEGMVFRSARGEFRIPWNMFHKLKANRDLILLYQSDVLFNVFPQRAFSSAADFEAFKQMLTAKVGSHVP